MSRKKTRKQMRHEAEMDRWAASDSLACYGCEVERHLTLEEAIALGWKEIIDANYDADDGELLDWYSHIGYCPACGVPVVEQLELF